MTERKLPFGGISSVGLHWIGMMLMLCDHLWATVIPGNDWMGYLGRLTFPIFAFLISEGYRHTSNLKAYKKRLLIFGLISEIPFNLIMMSSAIYPFQQNVMFTFLIALWAIEGYEKGRANLSSWKGWLRMVGQPLLCYIIGTISFVDYGGRGVLMVLGFYIFRNSKIGQLAMMLFLNYFMIKGQMISIDILGMEFMIKLQSLSILALPIIWLYNGEKGKGPNIGYWFYPVHMLILGMLMMYL